MNRYAALALLASAGPSVTSHAQECPLSAHRTASIDATGITHLVIDAAAGALNVQGHPGSQQIQARGTACTSSAGQLDEIRLEIRRDGATAYVTAVLPEGGKSLRKPSRHNSLDLTVNTPDWIQVKIDDSSGDTAVRNVRSADINDTSGDIEIAQVNGPVLVADSAGEIALADIKGNVQVSDSSGNIRIDEVAGNVELPSDSSGDIFISRVQGDVHIVEDSSGDIEIRGAQRDVHIDDDSSGDINVTDVGGKFTVDADGSGRIQHANVVGAVQIPES